MPVIKSMTRKDSSFGQLVDYLHKEKPNFEQLLGYINKESAQSNHVKTLLHNLPDVASEDIDGITQAFKDNDAFRHQRKNGVVQYHEVISFAPEDRETLIRNPQILTDMARKYLDLRAPHSLAIARPHFDQEHVHLHIMISGNQYQSKEPSRISKVVFEIVKQQLMEYQLEKYPELSNSVIEEHLKPELATKRDPPVGVEAKVLDTLNQDIERDNTPTILTTQEQIESTANEGLELEMEVKAIPSPYWNSEDAKTESMLSPYWNVDDLPEEYITSPYWEESEEDEPSLD